MATGPYRTLQDLILEVLSNLGVLSPGQPVDAEDYNYVLTKSDPTFRKLSALQIVNISDPDNIPAVYFSDVTACLAGECALKFGLSAEDYNIAVNAGIGGVQGVDVGQGAAAKSLRQINRLMPTGEVVKSEFF